MTEKKIFRAPPAALPVCIVLLIVLVGVLSAAPEIPGFDRYHTPAEVTAQLRALEGKHSGQARLHRLARTPGGGTVWMLEMGPETGKRRKSKPAVFVVANLEGTVPIATEAALYLAHLLPGHPDALRDRTWYILPLGNPDAAGNYFKTPRRMDNRNSRPHNDDMDDGVDEDGPDDLDQNGLITQMRVKHPEGTWLPVAGEPRLMKKADWAKGEKGLYKIYSEGIDNDGDGQYNEDGPGGTDVGINFPHLFKFFTADGGTWAGSEDETFSLFQFMEEHREIAMTICFGRTNFCMAPPRGGRKSNADFSNIKLPKKIAERFGYDPEKTYTMKQIMEKAKLMAPPGFKLTENIVAGFLGLGPAVNPLAADLKFYKEISAQYKKYLEKGSAAGKRLDPRAARDGSFELWSYYHLGLPSFSLDFWTPPRPVDPKAPTLTPDQLQAMSNDEFLALGEEKIDAFLKASGAPDRIKAKQVMEMVKGGMMDTGKMAEMMRQMPTPKGKEGADPGEKALLAFSDGELKGGGFIDWRPYRHPTLGDVEIGGLVPYAAHTPPARMLPGLLKDQVPWVFQLADKLPRIRIARTRTESLGNGYYRLKAWIENTGDLPYPTAMGERNQRNGPVVVTLSGKNYSLVEGKQRTIIKAVKGHGTQAATWIILAPRPVQLRVSVETPSAGGDARTVDMTVDTK